jgi:hypothetical protein
MDMRKPATSMRIATTVRRMDSYYGPVNGHGHPPCEEVVRRIGAEYRENVRTVVAVQHSGCYAPRSPGNFVRRKPLVCLKGPTSMKSTASPLTAKAAALASVALCRQNRDRLFSEDVRAATHRRMLEAAASVTSNPLQALTTQSRPRTPPSS